MKTKYIGLFPYILFLTVLLWLRIAFQVNALENFPDPGKQAEQYNAEKPKTIIELQQFRQTDEIKIDDISGKSGRAILTTLNPYVNIWYLLRLVSDDGTIDQTYHLESVYPDQQRFFLDPEYKAGIIRKDPSGDHPCHLFRELSAFQAPEGSPQTYTPFCSETLWLRNKTEGHKTTKEWAADFLRDYVWSGDWITKIIKGVFYKESYVRTSHEYTTGSPFPETGRNRPADHPGPPLIDAMFVNNYYTSTEMGIPIINHDPDKLKVGQWYPVDDLPGMFISILEPMHVSEKIKKQLKRRLAPLDDVEQSAMAYMVAFDLDQYETGFAMGTDHPRSGWSDRIQPKMRNNALPGPDGIGSYDPLVNTGRLNPEEVKQVGATFIGGFKRIHGVFRYSDLAWKNNGSHYGCMENGVVMSKLQPGLATILMYTDGHVDMKTWSESDNITLSQIRHARQNGVPLIDYDAAEHESRPGSLVRSISGNWSGSVDGRYRTIRAGLALQEYKGRRYLIFGCFSSATPSAMALVFQALQCKYAMLLDLSALEHAYLAVYKIQDNHIVPFHLLKGMRALDKTFQGKIIPRFVGYSDNRDFFYLLKKQE